MAGLAIRGWICVKEAPKAKTRRKSRVFVESCDKRATAYPAGMLGSGRRARDVIPAAMRALVTIRGWIAAGFMGFSSSEVAKVTRKRDAAQRS
jgi:hypothetical protein